MIDDQAVFGIVRSFRRQVLLENVWSETRQVEIGCSRLLLVKPIAV